MYAKYVYLFNNHVWFYQPILGKKYPPKDEDVQPFTGGIQGGGDWPVF